MGKELCQVRKLLKHEPKSYMKLVDRPTHVCSKCGRAGNSKKLLCSPTKIEA